MVSGYQNGTIAQLLQAIIGQINFDGEPISNIGNILLSILEQTPYDDEPKSVLAELFLKLKDKLEGRAFTPYDKEPKSVIAEILLSILNETEYDKEPTSRIAELLLELKAELESYAEITTSGAIANFTTSVVKPLVNLKAYFEATQEAGTPTPSEPKTISGVSEVVIVHQNGDNSIQSYFRNLFLGTYAFVNLGSLEWSRLSTDTTGKYRYRAETPEMKQGVWNVIGLLCSKYNIVAGVYNATITGLTVDYAGGKMWTLIHDAEIDTVTSEEFATAMNGVYLIYELATPTTPTFTPEQYQALCTAFGINGSTTLINLGGTYYGGYVEQDKDGHRELVVTWGSYTVTGDEGFTTTGSGQKALALSTYASDIKKPANNNILADLVCEFAENKTYNILNVAGDTDGIGCGTSFIIIGSNQYNNWANLVGRKFIYKLAEPFTVELPDGQPITTFNGVNNVWNDSGDTSVTYLAKIEDNLKSTAKFRAEVKEQKEKAKLEKELKELEEKETIKEPTKEIGDTKK